MAATVDGGATWSVVASQAAFGDDIIAGVSFVDAQEGWASGTGIYHTTDGGQTWTQQVAGSQDIGYLVDAYDATHALAAGFGVLSTTDTAGDTAAPVTLCDAAGGWTRISVAPALSAADVGAIRARVDRVQRGRRRLDGRASRRRRSSRRRTTRATARTSSCIAPPTTPATSSPRSSSRVRVDTVKPVTRLGPLRRWAATVCCACGSASTTRAARR